MNFLEFSQNETADVTSFNVSRPGKNLSTGIYVPTKFNDDEFLRTDKFSNALATFIAKAPALLKPFSEDGWKQRAVKELSGIAVEIHTLQRAAIKRSKDLDGRYEDWLVPKSIDPSLMAEIRSYVRNLKPADVMREAISNGVIANAIIQNPHGISGLDDKLFVVHVEKAAIEYNFSQAYASQMQRYPSSTSIIAYGTDQEAVSKYVAKALRNFEQSKSDISAVERILDQALGFYAVVADTDKDQAFNIINLGD